MYIKLFQPLFLNETGKRENNEDRIYPLPNKASENDFLFMVCDGVGGREKGEVASQLACKSFADYFDVHSRKAQNIDNSFILNAFEYVQQQFDAYFLTEPLAKGMGTTMTLLYFSPTGAILAHCGDSRIYHIRNNQVLYCTIDHSVVNELLRQGIITPEEAASQPKSNHISRAIQGNSVQRTKPDIHSITEINPNDYFLLCSDGVSGAISDTELTDILYSNQQENKKLEIIHTLCEANSKDNYSVYLLKVKTVDVDNELQTINKLINFTKNIFKKKNTLI